MITLKTLEQASAKEVFEQVKTHLLTQNAQSMSWGVDGEGVCAYRGDNGLKCAAGCLMGDDEYDHEMERLSWSWLVGKGKVPSKHSSLISDLQGIHDNYPPYDWYDMLTRTAMQHGIEP